MKKKVRHIAVDGQLYRYRLTWTRYLGDAAAKRYGVRYRFVAYLDGHTASPLQCSFLARNDRSETPLHGIPLAPDDPSSPRVNLARPREAAILIRLGLARGWKPAEQRNPFQIVGDDGLLEELVRELRRHESGVSTPRGGPE